MKKTKIHRASYSGGDIIEAFLQLSFSTQIVIVLSVLIIVLGMLVIVLVALMDPTAMRDLISFLLALKG